MNQIRKLVKFAHRNLYLRLLNLMASLLVPLECSGKLKHTHSNTVGFSQFRVHHRQRGVVVQVSSPYFPSPLKDTSQKYRLQLKYASS